MVSPADLSGTVQQLLTTAALAALRPAPTYWICPFHTRRTFSSNRALRDDKGKDLSNPILEKYLEKLEQAEAAGEKRKRPIAREGMLSPEKNTIFKPELEASLPKPLDPSPGALEKWKKYVDEHDRRMATDEELELTALKLDPDPHGRKKWERKMVITALRKRGRVTKAVKLKREEREFAFKSHTLPTSIKKLTKVMNQIAGKTVEDALVQLRFSKKKVAKDVWKGLKMARDKAIVSRGMGLGVAQEAATAEELKALDQEAEEKRKEKKQAKLKIEQEEAAKKARHGESTSTSQKQAEVKQEDSTTEEVDYATPSETELSELLLPDGVRRPLHAVKPTVIELKNGKSKNVYDPTEIYIDQAWVGRGTPTKTSEYRARGAMNLLTHPETSELAHPSCSS